MGEIENLFSGRDNTSELFDALEDFRRSVGGGDGGDRISALEKEVAVLGNKLENLEAKVDGNHQNLKTDIARVEAKLLTKWDMAQVVFFVVGALMAAVAFGPRIMALISG